MRMVALSCSPFVLLEFLRGPLHGTCQMQDTDIPQKAALRRHMHHVLKIILSNAVLPVIVLRATPGGRAVSAGGLRYAGNQKPELSNAVPHRGPT